MSAEEFSDQQLGQDPKLTSIVLNHDRFAEVEARLKSFINFENPEQGTYPSIAFQIQTKHDSFLKFYGFRDIAQRKPVNENTLYRLASMTKPVVAVSALILYERGYFYLNQPVSTFLPDFAQEKMKVIDLVSPSSTFTLINSITTEAGSSVVTIRAPSHDMHVNDRIGIKSDDKVGNLELNGTFTVTNIPTIDSFQVTTIGKATSTETLQGGVIAIDLLPHPDTLSLDEPKIGKRFYYHLVPLNKKLTLKHLLTHTSGYGDSNMTTRLGETMIQKSYANQAGLPDSLSNYYAADMTLEELTHKMSTVPLMFQPGEDWSYGQGYNILGAAISAIDPKKRDLARFQQEEIFDKLEMNDTFYFVSDTDPRRAEWLDNVHVLYEKVNGTWQPSKNAAQMSAFIGPRKFILPGAGLMSTVPDYIKFMTMLSNLGLSETGVRILSPTTVRFAAENQIGSMGVKGFPDEGFAAYTATKFGLGWGVEDESMPTEIKTPNILYWAGVWKTFFLVDIERNITTSTWLNTDQATVPSELWLLEDIGFSLIIPQD